MTELETPFMIFMTIMNILTLIIQIIVALMCGLAFLLTIPLYFSFRWPAAPIWVLKIIVSAFSPVLAAVGLITALIGLTMRTPFLALMGVAVFLMNAIHFIFVTMPPNAETGFEYSFGPDWVDSIPSDRKNHFLASRRVLWMPVPSGPRLQQNISFATIPTSGRSLLCDIWQPPENVHPSGLAFIYLHGSAFYILDKDYGTRTFFSHLATQGHVIMDVAYRLAPETDIRGMVHDVNRAIAWMKVQSSNFGVSEDRIVVGGGSAGGHLAMLAAYTCNDPFFTPAELRETDLSVCAVISLYGTCDLEALYYHTNQHLTTREIPGRPKKQVPTRMPAWMVKAIGNDFHRLGFDKGFENAGTLARLLGGHPDECPEQYSLLSPISHVHSNCPPTLLIHGVHDMMAPLSATRLLHQRLMAEKVPVVLHLLPQTDHAFDLAFPKIAPAAHNAIYDVERFLAFMASKRKAGEIKSVAVSNVNSAG